MKPHYNSSAGRRKKPFAQTLYKTAVCRKPAGKGRAARRSRTLVAVGDVHGEYDGFLELLRHAGLADARGAWRGGNATLVQIGDVVDRGPRPFEVQNLLARLQREAGRAGGSVVRLLGNHELELLKGNYAITTLSKNQIAPFTEALRTAVHDGRIAAALSRQGYLFTHAGLTAGLQEIFSAGGTAGEDALAAEINSIFINAVEKNDYSHPIFYVGSSRGGPHRFGGIFWEDIEDLFYSENPLRLKQVVGHTPLREVSVSDDGNIIAVDVGVYVGYGGGRGYLKLRAGKPEIVNLRPAS
ncbi:MAG: metallophosphoesterase [Elusimicrobiaceae bacterium]|nr:metallophosphoesterase [Elusimicrobiaceae bacterium]